MDEQKETVLCKDCVHSFRDWKDFWVGTYAYRCRKHYNPPSQEIDYVIGPQKKAAYYERCTNLRLKYSAKCGIDGKDWAPKHKKHFFTYLKKV